MFLQLEIQDLFSHVNETSRWLFLFFFNVFYHEFQSVSPSPYKTDHYRWSIGDGTIEEDEDTGVSQSRGLCLNYHQKPC